jgi:hypothetical protein
VLRRPQKARVGCDQYNITRNHHFDFGHHFPRIAFSTEVERSSLQARYTRTCKIWKYCPASWHRRNPGELKAWGIDYGEVFGCLSLQSQVV